MNQRGCEPFNKLPTPNNNFIRLLYFIFFNGTEKMKIHSSCSTEHCRGFLVKDAFLTSRGCNAILETFSYAILLTLYYQ